MPASGIPYTRQLTGQEDPADISDQENDDKMRGMHWLAALFLIISPTFVHADTAAVLRLCLDTGLTPEDRIEQLSSEGWEPIDTEALAALTAAITLARINAGGPTNWNADRSIAKTQAAKSLSAQNVEFLVGPGRQGVFVGRNRTGLQTCLYLGDTPDLGPLDRALDGALLRQIDHVSRIRGDGVKSLISAHAITDAGRRLFHPPLAYGLTFSVQLDRQPGDTR